SLRAGSLRAPSARAAESAFSVLSFRFPLPAESSPFPSTTLFRSRAGRPCGGRTGRSRPRAWNAHAVGPAEPACLHPGQRLGQLRSEEHTSELQSRFDLVCRLLPEKKNTQRGLADGLLLLRKLRVL